MRMMQRQKMQQYGLGEDYDQEWDLFCVLCEMLRTIIMNKMGCEAPHEVDHFEKSYSSLTSDADRVNFIISHPDISCILKYFAREFCSLKQEFGQAFAKSDEIAERFMRIPFFQSFFHCMLREEKKGISAPAITFGNCDFSFTL